MWNVLNKTKNWTQIGLYENALLNNQSFVASASL